MNRKNFFRVRDHIGFSPFSVLDSRVEYDDADRPSVRFLQGFDEFMNVVMDEAAEVYVKESKPRRELGTRPRPCSAIHIVTLPDHLQQAESC